MDLPELPLLFHWFDETVQLLQRLFIVVIAAFISIRFEWLRQALRGTELKWRYRIPAMLVFGLLAIVGTHSGIPIDVHQGWQSIDISADLPVKLGDTQAIVGFRDTIVLIAGMIAGPWVGFGAGLIAGVERYQLGGLAASASGFATVLLGLFAGGVRHFRPHWVATVKGVFWVAATGTALHRLTLLILVKPFNDALALSWEVFVPVAILNTLGCVLFFWILRDLDRDRIENEAQEARVLALQAELRALRAQVDPHFLNNALNDLNSLIRRDPDKARHYVVQLAGFFKYTRMFAGLDTIKLTQELAQVKRYLELQRLGLDDKLQDSYTVAKELLNLHVLPGCLLTLVENALKHGFKARPAPYQLHISAHLDDAYLILQVSDNGGGIAPERLAELGKYPVRSDSDGGGVALHQLLRSMRLVFGEQVDLSFSSTVNQGTVARLKQPKKE